MSRREAPRPDALIALIVPAFVLPGTAQASVRVTLRPRTGGPRTGFVLRFRNPSRTGKVAGVRRVDEVLVSGPRASNCVSTLTYSLRPAATGAGMRTVVRPGAGDIGAQGAFMGGWSPTSRRHAHRVRRGRARCW